MRCLQHQLVWIIQSSTKGYKRDFSQAANKCTFLQYLNTFLLKVTASSAMESQCPEDKTNYLRQWLKEGRKSHKRTYWPMRLGSWVIRFGVSKYPCHENRYFCKRGNKEGPRSLFSCPHSVCSFFPLPLALSPLMNILGFLTYQGKQQMRLQKTHKSGYSFQQA